MQTNTEIKLSLEDFEIRRINAEGGHKYIVSNITYKGKLRRVSVFFEHKYDEEKLDSLHIIHLKGILKDDGNEDMLLSQAVLL